MGSGLGLGLGSGCEGCAKVTARVVGESGDEEGDSGCVLLAMGGSDGWYNAAAGGGRWRDELSDFTLLGKLRLGAVRHSAACAAPLTRRCGLAGSAQRACA